MGNCYVAGLFCGARIYSQCLNWLFVAHFLWRDTLLSLDTVGRALVLPQSNVLDFVDSPWEVLSSLRSGWESGVAGTGGGESEN